MEKKVSRLSFVFTAVVGLAVASPVFAELGLQQIAAGPQGAQAVGQSVLAAAQAVYSNNKDSAAIQQQLIAILNEAAATGNEQAVRYSIVAVMMAGGVENLALSKAAIDNSDVFGNYEALTAVTVAATETLLKASVSGKKEQGGGEKEQGGGEKEQGGGEKEQGGGEKVFPDPNNPFAPGFIGGDGDLPATRT